jgi:hypothetical protein
VNINNLKSPISPYASSLSESQTNPLLETGKADSKQSPHLEKKAYSNLPNANLSSGYFGLSPMAKYQYQSSNLTQASTNKLRQIPGNPEQTIKNADEIIDEAIFSPLTSDPGSSDMLQAIQNKRIAQSQLAKRGNLGLNLLG